MFRDRKDAGKHLANQLLRYRDQSENLVVLAIPRGGLPIGKIIARSLGAPLDVVLSKKLGHPRNREFAIGAVSPESFILTDEGAASREYIESEISRIRKKLAADAIRYRHGRPPVDLTGKIVVIVDDGIATGNTILATARLVYGQNPLKTVVAIPVASPTALQKLQNSEYIDEVVCLSTPRYFQAVGQFYDSFEQVTDEEAIELLDRSNQEWTA
ncbi:phosphoribosyltransferase family protein [Robiginitalea sp. SC105]|uniref:phosphoribosyltransferase n=1 Tax=Robiginitalea sp. SC105 TaxID=2762332 RepID=UPI00163ADCE0|nr:phosphoribosyltransferase [Robiginitalea sp. SC105]